MNKQRFLTDPPPGFRGLDPNREIELYERNLPHWRQEGATYFVTFRLADSLPQPKLDELKAMRQCFVEKLERSDGLSCEERDREWQRLARESMEKTEAWLDQGMGSCVLKAPGNRKVVEDALLFFDSVRHETGAFVVMPNHVHVILRPFEEFSLEQVLHSIKRESSRKINQRTGKAGKLWQEESHDRIVRDAEHLWKCLQYIGRNPSKAGLGEGEHMRWVSPIWKEHGWDFLRE